MTDNTPAYTLDEPDEVVYARRGAWDFTGAQRIILAILLWLNILVLVIGYLVITGQLSV